MRTNRSLWSQRALSVSLLTVVAIGGAGCGGYAARELSSSDRQSMREAAASYAAAWLSNDPEMVMSLFVPDPVLSPSGTPFVEGQDAARQFWWPKDAPPMTITEFELVEREAGGGGNYGFVRGDYRLAFVYAGVSRVNFGTYVSLLEKTANGAWRISHHFWNDLPQDGGL